MHSLIQSLGRVGLGSHGAALNMRSARASSRQDELQEAVKYGKKERANPGRDGTPRLRFTHKGTIYITDAAAKHLITSWPMRDLDNVELPQLSTGADAIHGSHTVIVVDASGSMRKGDVPGYTSRTDAVYDCLARDFLMPQLEGSPGGENLVSLLEMSDETNVIFKRKVVSEKMKATFEKRRISRARSHGNYIPMLDAVTNLLMPETKTQRQILIMILSDGAPSDHNERECIHGTRVWQPAKPNKHVPTRFMLRDKAPLRECVSSKGRGACRQAVLKSVQTDCVQKVIRLGDLFGRDRTTMVLAAFGHPKEDFKTLHLMAKVLPKGSFQKLGLNPRLLSTAFTSLSSSLTSLRGGHSLTERTVVREDPGQMGTGGWHFYPLVQFSDPALPNDRECLEKEQYSLDAKGFIPAAFGPDVKAVVHSRRIFGSGAERQVYHFYEVSNERKSAEMHFVGDQLTAKQPKHVEHVNDQDFMRRFCRVQAKAQELAVNFNRRINGKGAWHINFVKCYIYTLKDLNLWEKGTGTVLAEAYLEGKFVKWNSNGGYVKPLSAAAPSSKNLASQDLFVLGEDDEEDEDEDEDAGCFGSSQRYCAQAALGEDIEAEHAPQAFSHFTYSVSDGMSLVCDLQGVWNETDGFMLTDPVIHHASSKGKNGRTDKGKEGMKKFFESHKCNPLCRRLGLDMPLLA